MLSKVKIFAPPSGVTFQSAEAGVGARPPLCHIRRAERVHKILRVEGGPSRAFQRNSGRTGYARQIARGSAPPHRGRLCAAGIPPNYQITVT
jgi:hypothetical protein